MFMRSPSLIIWALNDWFKYINSWDVLSDLLITIKGDITFPCQGHAVLHFLIFVLYSYDKFAPSCWQISPNNEIWLLKLTTVKNNSLICLFSSLKFKSTKILSFNLKYFVASTFILFKSSVSENPIFLDLF